MKWIGLTGGIATGKSTVSKMLRDLGIPVVDADHLARQAVSPGTEGQKLVEQAFGAEVFSSSGELDRKKLGAIIFSNDKMRKLLESILHPRIQELRAKERRELEQQGFELAFYDVPLLFEKHLEGEFDATVLVYASEAEQKARLAERDNLSENEIQSRLSAQIPIDHKIKLATYVVFNQGQISDLKKNVLTVLEEIKKK